NLFLARLEVGEHAQLFEHAVFQRLRLVDHHDDVAARGELLEQVRVETVEELEPAAPVRRNSELHADELEKLVEADARIEDEYDLRLTLDLVENSFEEGRLAGARLSDEREEPLTRLDSVENRRHRLARRLVDVVKLRVRRQIERIL